MAINNLALGVAFTAKDLASRVIRDLEARFKGLKGTTEATAARFSRNMGLMKKGLIQFGIGAIGLKIASRLSKPFEEFEAALVGAGNVMKATSAEMKQLEDVAIKAGIATQFSPTEAVQGLENLGSAGLDAATAMRVLNPVLDLAAASMGKLGVAGAATAVTAALNSFGETSDKARLRVDQLTRITQLSSFQWADFQIAISQAGAQAKISGQSFESMLAVLGLLRGSGLDASSAATAYREALRRLSGDQKAINRLVQLGISPIDKQTGGIRDLGSIIAEMVPKLQSMNVVQKNLILTQVFGVRGLKVFAAFTSQYNKLLAEGKVKAGDFAGAQRRMVGALKGAGGAAAEARRKFLQTAAGQRVLLKGSVETFKVLLGQTITPVLLPALKALTTVLNTVIKLFKSIPGPIKTVLANIAGVAAAFLAFGGAIKLVVGAVGLLKLGGLASKLGGVGSALGGASKAAGLLSRGLGFIGRNLPLIGAGVGLIVGIVKEFNRTNADLIDEQMRDSQRQTGAQVKEQQRRQRLQGPILASQRAARQAFLQTEIQAKRAARAAAEAAGKHLQESKAGEKQARRALADIQQVLVSRILAAKKATARLSIVEDKLARQKTKGVERTRLTQEKIQLQRTIETARRVVNVQKFADLRGRGLVAETTLKTEKDLKKRARLTQVAIAGRLTFIQDAEKDITGLQESATAARSVKSFVLAKKLDAKIAALRERQAKARGVGRQLLGITKGDTKQVRKFMAKVAGPELKRVADLQVGLRARAITAIKTEKTAALRGLSAGEIKKVRQLAASGQIKVPGPLGGFRKASKDFLSDLRGGQASATFRQDPIARSFAGLPAKPGAAPVGAAPTFGGFGARPAPQKLVFNMDGKKIAEVIINRIKLESTETGTSVVQ